MFWRKTEHRIDPHCKKISLKRKTFWGKPHVRKFVEIDEPPSPNGNAIGTVYCLTKRRFLWRFRLWTPLQSTYISLNKEGQWIQICRTFH